MNDPWDVKSVRQSSQYVSCMKINGVPLLPPVLSKECRKEMQYYKLLAKEVEKRISMLQPHVFECDTESSEDKTDAPELPENEQNYELPPEQNETGFNAKITTISTEKTLDHTINDSPKSPTTNVYNNITSNVTVVEANETTSGINSPKFVTDVSLNMNEIDRNVSDTIKKTTALASPPVDLPERDYNYPNKITQKELLTEFESVIKYKQKDEPVNDIVNFNMNVADIFDPFPDLPLNQDGPPSLTSKSFTGSLIDIHKESSIIPNLTRQRSYTLLKPSPQLLAHLEVQSLNTGVEMSCISMSESLSNLSTPSKKRRSWDLESAKVKWSSMALELRQKKLPNAMITNNASKNQLVRQQAKKTSQVSPPKATTQISPPRAMSVVAEKTRHGTITNKTLPKSEPIQKTKRLISPARNAIMSSPGVKEPATLKPVNHNKESISLKQTPQHIPDTDDPATRVRELYEKIQTQQLIQMASLVEKQKREQMLLQQVFEEQNNLLYKQLKTICPKSPTGTTMKEDWKENDQEVDRGPVSLSQLISPKSPDQSSYDSSVSSTLNETNNYISHCDNVLKKSRDISGSIKKPQTKSRSQNGTKIQSRRGQGEGSRTRTNSPSQRNTSTSRRLNYDTSASSEREYEPILTNRTNDTMADLNVTFPSDNTDECVYNNTVMNHLCGKEIAVIHTSPAPTNSGIYCRSTDSAIRSMEKTIQQSINSMYVRPANPNIMKSPPTAKEQAAATKIVAYAKGYLVRRLMRTERVQGTVQTIKDALLCALQLHQDREGIRGADVDLHRRLIQQITAACYSLHDTFIASTPAERCAMIAADRGRRRSLAARQPPKSFRPTDIMSQSHSGAFPPRGKRPSAASLMTQSNYETFSSECTKGRSRYMPSPRRRPWR